MNSKQKIIVTNAMVLAATVLWFSIMLALFCCGCVYRGCKLTEGTDLAVGLNVPMSEGTLQLQVLNYLSGFRVGVDRNAIMRVRYTVAETNDYLGVVKTCVRKEADVTVEPCEVGGQDAEAGGTAEAGK